MSFSICSSVIICNAYESEIYAVSESSYGNEHTVCVLIKNLHDAKMTNIKAAHVALKSRLLKDFVKCRERS